MKVVLQDCANATRRGTVPRSNLSSFSNSRPSTTVVPGQATGVSGVTVPAESSAVAVIVFMLDPGGKWPGSALPESAAAFDETARISPVPGRTTTRWVGGPGRRPRRRPRSGRPGTSGVWTGVPGFGPPTRSGAPVVVFSSVLATVTREARRAGELVLEGPLQPGEPELVAVGVPRRAVRPWSPR